MIGILIAQIVVSIVLASIFLVRPSVTIGAGWKILAFIRSKYSGDPAHKFGTPAGSN